VAGEARSVPNGTATIATESSFRGVSGPVASQVFPEQTRGFVFGRTVETVRRALEASAVDDANAIAHRADQPLALKFVQGDGDALAAHAHQQRQEVARHEHLV